jgi:FkbM family methyltransferase
LAYGRHLAALGSSPSARAKLVWTAVWLPTRAHLGRPRGRPISLSLVKDGRRVRMAVRDVADLTAIGDVLLDELYDVPDLRDVRVIVDLGSHIGSSIVFFRVRHPGAQIHGLEPDPRTFATLAANVGALEGVTVDRQAVSDADGEATFFCSDYSMASSLVGDGRPVTVRTVRLDTLMDELGLDRIDLLKLDIEGAEYDVLAATERLGAVRAICGEVHPHLISRSPDEFFDLLSDFHVRIDRFSPTSWQFHARRA